MNKESVQVMKLSDEDLGMVNGGARCQHGTGNKCPYREGNEVDKYNICAGQKYIAYTNGGEWHLVQALSDNYEKPGAFSSTNTYADFLILNAKDSTKINTRVSWRLNWYLFRDAVIYEYLG